MSHPLLGRTHIDGPAEPFLHAIGVVFAEFGWPAQDSGNRSFGVQIGAEHFFVKTAGSPDDVRSALAHGERVALLRSVARLHATCRHPALVPLLHVVEAPAGPLLVFPWVEGELLYVRREERVDPASTYQRFRRLPPSEVGRCLDAIFSLHVALAEAGWVAADFYDGCLLYDFDAGRLGIVDLDLYQPGPFQNPRVRWFGSTRFMAPEEFIHGARIDERTTVFTLGRTALVLLSDPSGDEGAFRGPRECLDVARIACSMDPAARFASPAVFYERWRQAWGQGAAPGAVSTSC